MMNLANKELPLLFFPEAKSCADGLFQEVLGRKDKADSTRNALSVLQRFKFLFYLPLNIERNIQKVNILLYFLDNEDDETSFYFPQFSSSYHSEVQEGCSFLLFFLFEISTVI